MDHRRLQHQHREELQRLDGEVPEEPRRVAEIELREPDVDRGHEPLEKEPPRLPEEQDEPAEPLEPHRRKLGEKPDHV